MDDRYLGDGKNGVRGQSEIHRLDQGDQRVRVRHLVIHFIVSY